MNMSLQEYAKSINAELKPTVLADMAVLKVIKSNNYTIGSNKVIEWLRVNDPSGGINGYYGYWEYSVEQKPDGSLIICAASH